MNHLNDVKLLCNLCRDVQLSYTPNGTAVADFGVAVNSRWIGQDGQAKEDVCFIDVKIFGKQGEAANKWLHKGSPVFICGRIKMDSWTGQDGKKKTKHYVIGDKVIFLPSGKEQATGQAPDDPEPPAGENYPKSEPRGGTGNPDEIPF